MKLITFEEAGSFHLGVQTERGVLDVEAAIAAKPELSLAPVPSNLREILDGGDVALKGCRNLLMTCL